MEFSSANERYTSCQHVLFYAVRLDAHVYKSLKVLEIRLRSMAKKLVIVESPAKAKTIEKFLGRDFEVRASLGHNIDLPKKGLGVNTRKDFTPQYVVIEKKDKLIDELKAASKRADEVYLAPDPDREGEFIAWSLKSTLELQNPRRAVFNEITRGAVQDAI